jgi:thymidylate kinase
MTTVAVIGADGAGKTTVARRLPAHLDAAVYLYLGANPAAATHALPTTRLVHRLRTRRGTAAAGGPPPLDRSLGPDRRGSAGARALRSTRAAARTAHQIAEGGYQRAAIGWHRRRGRIVVVDRWYTADHHAHELAPDRELAPSRRVRAAFLRRAFGPPDLVLLLDAPVEVLHARKGEGTIEELAARRAEYVDYLGTVPRGRRIDATRPVDDVLAAAVAAIEDLTTTRPPRSVCGKRPQRVERAHGTAIGRASHGEVAS